MKTCAFILSVKNTGVALLYGLTVQSQILTKQKVLLAVRRHIRETKAMH